MQVTDTCRRLVFLALLSCAAARAEDDVRHEPLGEVQVRLEVSGELHVGEHALLAIEVTLPAQAGTPLLVTPYREGEAIEIVKGRLLRSDARDPKASPLHFELPVLARAAGTALVGVRLLAYVCRPGCHAVEVERRVQVVVLP